jgi:Bacterial lectin
LSAVNYGTGFPCTGSPLRLNPGPRAFPQLITTSSASNLCLLRLTPDNTGRAVSAWLPYRMSTGYAFTTTFTYSITGSNNGEGDGLAFGVHMDPRGIGALGEGGGSLGIYGANMIMPGLFVEIDTCAYYCLVACVVCCCCYLVFHRLRTVRLTIHPLPPDRNQYGFPADDFTQAVHVTITQGGKIFEVEEVSATVRIPDALMTVTIASDGDTLQVLVNGVARVAKCVNLADHFSGSRDVSVGFTAGTGSVADQQDILTWTMSNSLPAANLLSCGPRTAEVRQPSPAPVPRPPTNMPVQAPTVQVLPNFWDWIRAIFAALADFLRLRPAAM